MKVKICGITSIQDGLGAAQAGADLLGFNFYQGSPRAIDIATCRKIVSHIQQEYPHIVLVGIFVNETSQEVERILEACDLDLAQLSGDEPVNHIHGFKGRAYKALRPDREGFLETEAKAYLNLEEPALLLDAHQPGLYGGTGTTGNWQAAARLAQIYPILLAGGLNPGNVSRAVRSVRPWGVDVASGVESTPGRKDIEKVREFIRIAKQVEIERQVC
jgi:phosphoribosylanthranilate isomerase